MGQSFSVLNPLKELEQVKGIELSLSAWETMVGGVSGGHVSYACVRLSQQNTTFLVTKKCAADSLCLDRQGGRYFEQDTASP